MLTLFDRHAVTKEDFLVWNAAAIHFLAAYLLWIGAFNVQMKIKELRGIAQLTAVCEDAGLILFDESFAKMAHYIVYISIVAFVSLELLVIIVVAINKDYSLKIFKRLWTDTSIFMQCTINTHYMLLQLVMIRLFQKLLAEIKCTTEKLFDGKTAWPRNDEDSIKQSFSSRLQILHRLYQGAYLSFMDLNNFINPAFLIWWNVVLIGNIVCAYILINSIMLHQPLGLHNLFFLLLYYGTFIGLVGFLILMGVLTNVVSFCNFITMRLLHTLSVY